MDHQAILYDYAKSFLGLPYIWGGDDPIYGLDCSGFCVELLKAAGVLQRNDDLTAAGLRELCKDKPLTFAEFGALAFYGHTSHVAFCLNDKFMIEAGGGTSATKTKDDAAKQNAFIRVRPILSRKDFSGLYMPNYPWKGAHNA